MRTLQRIVAAVAVLVTAAGALTACSGDTDTWATADGGCKYPAQAVGEGVTPQCDDGGRAAERLKVRVTCVPGGVVEEALGVKQATSRFGVASDERFAGAQFGPDFERVESYNADIPVEERDVYSITVTPPNDGSGSCSLDVLNAEDSVLFSDHDITVATTAAFVVDADPDTEENTDFVAPAGE